MTFEELSNEYFNADDEKKKKELKEQYSGLFDICVVENSLCSSCSRCILCPFAFSFSTGYRTVPIVHCNFYKDGKGKLEIPERIKGNDLR